VHYQTGTELKVYDDDDDDDNAFCNEIWFMHDVAMLRLCGFTTGCIGRAKYHHCMSTTPPVMTEN